MLLPSNMSPLGGAAEITSLQRELQRLGRLASAPGIVDQPTLLAIAELRRDYPGVFMLPARSEAAYADLATAAGTPRALDAASAFQSALELDAAPVAAALRVLQPVTPTVEELPTFAPYVPSFERLRDATPITQWYRSGLGLAVIGSGIVIGGFGALYLATRRERLDDLEEAARLLPVDET